MKNTVKTLSLCLGLASLALGQTTTTAPNYTMSIIAGMPPGVPLGIAGSGGASNTAAYIPSSQGAGDGIAAGIASILVEPMGMAVDASGNIFITEWMNQRIRRIDGTTGVITTFANYNQLQPIHFPSQSSTTPGTIQPLNGPSGLAFDNKGFLYVANENNHTIIRFNTTTGVATAVLTNSNGRYCGDGVVGQAFYACLANPNGIAFDANNDMFIADSGNGRIRYMPNTNNCLYATPVQTCTIYTIAGNNGSVTPIPPISTAQIALGPGVTPPSKLLTTPTAPDGSGDGGLAIYARLTNSSNGGVWSVAASADGSKVYFSDIGTHRVRMITMSTGIISTVLGACTTAGLSTTASAPAPTSNAAAGLSGNNSSKQYVIACPSGTYGTATSGSIGSTSTLGDGGQGNQATANAPRGISLDTANNILYVADTSNHRIRAINLNTGIVNTVIGNGTQGDSSDSVLPNQMNINTPNTAVVTNGGLVYFIENPSGLGNNNMNTPARIRVTNLTGTTQNVAPAQGSSTSPATPTGLPPLGTLTLTGTAAFKYTGSGGPASSAFLATPTRVNVDPAGNIYISENTVNKIRMIDTSGVIHDFVGTGVSGVPLNKNPLTGQYIDGGPAVAARINIAGSVGTTGTGGGMTFDANGNMYFADTGNNLIRKVDTNGNISTVVGRASVSCTLAQEQQGCVADLEGTKSYLGDGGPATLAILNAPQDVASDAVGNLYIADTGNNAIRMVSAATGVITTIAGGVTTAANALAQAAGAPGIGGPIDGRSGSGTGFTGTEGVNALLSSFNSPRGVAVDSNGNVYVADYSNDAIRELISNSHGGYNVITVLGTLASNGDGAPGIPTGATGQPQPPLTGQIRNPMSVHVDSQNRVYAAIPSWNVGGEGRIIMVTPQHTAEYGIAGIGASVQGASYGTAGNTTTPLGYYGVIVGTTYAPGQNAYELFTPGALGVGIDPNNGNVYVVDQQSLLKKLTPPAKYPTLAP
jgi:sugar lactone lactonase YvrE